ncbi:beta-sandwich lipoprotein [Arthrobacter terricola]
MALSQSQQPKENHETRHRHRQHPRRRIPRTRRLHIRRQNSRIVGINTRTDKYLFYVEGRCSIERSGDLIITCKQGPNDYRKHYIGQATDVAWVSTQLEGVDVSVYHTRIVIKPEGIIPEIDLQGGKQ